MNGIHDMGGMHGFGKVEVERDEPVFHSRWEARVFGMVQSLGGGNIDAGRHSIERLGPVEYLKDGYYGRWLASLLQALIRGGALTLDELKSRMKSPPPTARPATEPKPWRPAPRSYTRHLDATPKFAPGQEVATRNHQPSGHTRLPAYARCRHGTIVLLHPAMVYPDDNAHGRGENPQYLYTVRFAAHELWGDAAESNTCVHIDLFESYLEPVGKGAAAKKSSSKRRAAPPRV